MYPANRTHPFARVKTLSLAVLAALSIATMSSRAIAGPADKVYMPIVEPGEFEIEFRGGDESLSDGGHNRALVLDAGYGITSRWFTELVLEYEESAGSSGELEAIEWENVFQLTEQGKYWVDVGLFAEYEFKREAGSADEIVLGPMFQKDIRSTQINLNILLERQVGSGADSELEVGYAAQAKWRSNPKHEFGLQAFGEEDEHRLGPAIFGTYRLDSGNKLKFDAALLAGVTDDAPDLTARFQVEYEMY